MEFLDAMLEEQKQEMDCFLQLQNSRLRSYFQEQMTQQLTTILSNIESKAMPLMRQKEEDIQNANKKTLELQEWLRRVEVESESWQRLATQNEAIVANLQNSLQHVRERMCLLEENNGVDDAESSCYGSREQLNITKLACKHCNSRKSCVIFMPCMHLCTCRYCDAFLGYCPACGCLKHASMEVFLA